MVSQHAMATTVRKVKQENRLRRQNQSQGTQMHDDLPAKLDGCREYRGLVP